MQNKLKYPFLDLRYATAPLRDELVEAAVRVIDSGRYIGGREVELFEAKLADKLGTSYAVGLSNGLDALRLSLRALVELGRLKPGDGVAVQANTFVASVLAISDAGLRPVLMDIDRETLAPTAEALERAADEGAKAFMPVHLYGIPVWNESIASVVRDRGLRVVEDNAQAVGAIAAGFGHTGALGHVGAISFYPTKNVGALGDAGAITTNDQDIAAMVRALANYGSDRRYHNLYRGFNCRMDPIQAAMISVKLDHMDEENVRRRGLAEVYDRCITNPDVIKLRISAGNVWHQYVVMHPRRDDLRKWLLDNGIETDIHYAVPPHRQPCYESSLVHGPLPVTEFTAGTIVSLPVGAHIGREGAEEISSVINRFE